MSIYDTDDLLFYHNYINADTTVEVINYMLEEINKGIKYFNVPVVIICSGGGFSYISSI